MSHRSSSLCMELTYGVRAHACACPRPCQHVSGCVQNKTKQNKTKIVSLQTRYVYKKQNKIYKHDSKFTNTLCLQNKTKQNKTKQNKTKQNKTKQNKTKQNKINIVSLQTRYVYKKQNKIYKHDSKFTNTLCLQNQTKPNQTKPNQTKPNQTKPNQTKPNQTKQNKTKQNKTKQNQTKPNQTKPNQTKPNQTKPNQTKPNQTKPNKTKQNKTTT